MQVLRTLWVQNYHRTVTEAGTEVKRRESKDLPPGRLRLASPYDTEARYGLKQGSWWTGYKIHISESCDDADDQDPAADGQALIPGADGTPPRLGIPQFLAFGVLTGLLVGEAPDAPCLGE